MAEFAITSTCHISKAFTDRGILSFSTAAEYIRQLPYGRNANKQDLLTLFDDQCGTCSTKHALLKGLAEENGFNDLKLILGLFKMNRKNTPQVSKTLAIHSLEFIPEAHCYLKYENQILDFTKSNADPASFENDLIHEIEITPEQIVDYKINYHKNYLNRWLAENEQIPFSLQDIWTIREQCILDLSYS